MKRQTIKTLLKLILLTLLLFFNSCTDMKSQTEEIINHNRTQLNDDLKKLEEQKIITQSESKQINKQLNADFDFYLQHQDIDFAGLEKMFFKTIKNFENIKINQPIFIVITSTTYHTITSQIAMRNFPNSIKKEDYAIQSKLNNVMNNWFENYQNDSEKIQDLISQINKTKQLKIYSDISDSEYDEILIEITKIKNDTTISENELKKTLTDGMLKYCNKNNNSNLSILNIYAAIDRIKKLGINQNLLAIYKRNEIQSKELTYSAIKEQISGRFKILLSEKMITQQQYLYYTKTIIEDVDFCENTTNKEQIKTQLLTGLRKLKTAELDTEDREAIIDWYFILSQKSKIDIKSNLNSWLYDF